MDFGEILRSKIPILRVKARRKTHKCIALGQFGSIPVRLRLGNMLAHIQGARDQDDRALDDRHDRRLKIEEHQSRIDQLQ